MPLAMLSQTKMARITTFLLQQNQNANMREINQVALTSKWQ